MREGLTPERLVLALRSLASDLVSARAELSRLRRENRELKAQLAALEARGPDHGEEADARSRQRV